MPKRLFEATDLRGKLKSAFPKHTLEEALVIPQAIETANGGRPLPGFLDPLVNPKPIKDTTAMASTWHHPQLGCFVRISGKYWRGLINAPAFDAFAHVGRRRADRPPPGKYKLELAGAKGASAPLPEAVDLAESLVATQSALVPKVTAALWADFNGQDHDCGVWWHNNLAGVIESAGVPLTGPDDILPLLRLDDIIVLDSADASPLTQPVIYLGFRALFEEEHGLAVLTDSQHILGTGFHGEAVPYGFKFR